MRNHLRNSQNLRNFGHDKDQVQVFSPGKSLSRFSWKNDQAIKSLRILFSKDSNKLEHFFLAGILKTITSVVVSLLFALPFCSQVLNNRALKFSLVCLQQVFTGIYFEKFFFDLARTSSATLAQCSCFKIVHPRLNGLSGKNSPPCVEPDYRSN